MIPFSLSDTDGVFFFYYTPCSMNRKKVRHWLCITPLHFAACTTGLNHPLHLLSLIFCPCYSLKFTLNSFSSSPSWFMPSFLVTVGGICMNYFPSLSDPSSLTFSVTCSSAPSQPVMLVVSAVTRHT